MFSGFKCVFMWNMSAVVVENCGLQLSSTGKLFTFHSCKCAALCFVFVPAGYSRVNKPSVLHDSCNSRMFIRLHAAGVHSTKLNRLCVRTSHGQRHGRMLTSALTLKHVLNPFRHLSSRFLPCFLRWKPALSWTSWASSPSLWPWTRGALQCLTCTRIQNGLDPSTRLRSLLACTSHPSSQWMLRSDHSISAWARRRDQKIVNRFNTKQGQESAFRHLCHYNVGTLWELHLLPIMMNLIILGCLRRLSRVKMSCCEVLTQSF